MVSNILDPNEVGRGFEDTGVAIRDAMRGELAYLGDPTTELIEQLPDGTFVQDVAGFVDAVLVHGLRENPAGVRYAQWPADLDRRFRGIFRTPVRVTPGSHGHLVITRLAIEESAEWLHNVPTPQQFSIKLPSIDFLALRAQSPASWTLRVSPGLAIEAGVQYLVQTYQTAFDFETEAAGVTAGNALAVLVTVTPSTNTFGFNVGSEFVYDPATQTPSHEAAFGDYPSTVTPPAIPIGYVRLYPTQTEITQDDIFPAQLGGSGGGGIPFSLPVDDTTAIVNDPVDDTRLMRIDVGNVATATTRTLEMPDADVLLRKNNYAASVAPAVSDDNTQGYAVGSVWIDTTADLVYQCADASTGAAVWLLLSDPAPVAPSVAVYVDSKAQNTAQNTYLAGAYRTIVLTTEEYDPDGIGSLSSNQVTLAAGRYHFNAEIVLLAGSTWRANLRLEDVTNTVTLAESIDIVQSTNVRVWFPFSGGFTLASTATLELQVFSDVNTSATGTLNRSGKNEIYTRLTFTRVAT